MRALRGRALAEVRKFSISAIFIRGIKKHSKEVLNRANGKGAMKSETAVGNKVGKSIQEKYSRQF